MVESYDPSYTVSTGDVVGFKEGFVQNVHAQAALEISRSRGVPIGWNWTRKNRRKSFSSSNTSGSDDADSRKFDRRALFQVTIAGDLKRLLQYNFSGTRHSSVKANKVPDMRRKSKNDVREGFQKPTRLNMNKKHFPKPMACLCTAI
jgi:hypothetical protein